MTGRSPKKLQKQPDRDLRATRPWRILGLGAGALGAPLSSGHLHPYLGAAVILAELAIAVTLITVIVAGSTDRAERVFRLLRWLADRPEPPAPGPDGSAR